jgi:hypothetical protein
MVGNRASPIELRVSTGSINLVKDVKYLGSWLLNCTKDFEIRKALAWKACIRLIKIWKSNQCCQDKAITCVESTLLYNAVTCTLTDTLSRKLDGCYTKLLCYALNYKWSDYVPHSTLYNGLEFGSIRLLELLLWDHTIVNCKCSKGTSSANYSRQLLKAIGRVEGLVTSDKEVHKLMLDRETWRSKIKMIVAKNKEVDACKREDRKTWCIKTRR